MPVGSVQGLRGGRCWCPNGSAVPCRQGPSPTDGAPRGPAWGEPAPPGSTPRRGLGAPRLCAAGPTGAPASGRGRAHRVGCAARPALAVAVTQQHFHSPLPRKPPSQAAPLALTPLLLLPPPARAMPCHAIACHAVPCHAVLCRAAPPGLAA